LLFVIAIPSDGGEEEEEEGEEGEKWGGGKVEESTSRNQKEIGRSG